MSLIQALNNPETRDLIEGLEEWSEKAEAGCKIAQDIVEDYKAELKQHGYEA